MPADRWRWLSAHLHFDGNVYGQPADEVITRVVGPVADECRSRRWIRRFFFLRYTAGGPHIRLRFYGRSADLDRRVRPLLVERAGEAVHEIAWSPYEPELDRYGGPAGVAVAERLFEDSSRLALALVPEIPSQDRSARLGKALLSILALVHVFVGDRAAAAATMWRYGDDYLRQLVPDPDHHSRLFRNFEQGLSRQADTLGAYVEAAWSALEEGRGLPAAMARYKSQVEATRERLRRLCDRHRLLAPNGEPWTHWRPAAASIFPSYLHMTNNRLGVSIQEEAYLAVVASGTLVGETGSAGGQADVAADEAAPARHPSA